MPDGSIILEIEARDNGLTKTLTQAQSAAIKTAASMQTLAQSVQQTTRSVSALAASFHTAGTSWGMSLTAGFRTGLTGVTGVSQSAVNSALIPWKSAGSAAFSLGYAVPSGAAQGMNAGNFLVSQAAAVCARSIQSAFSGGGWGNLGYQISGGIARGIASGSSLISVAARSAAQSALKTAKNSLGIRSPSRLFRDEVGKMIPAGMAEGILDGAGELGNAISDASRRLLSFSRQTLNPSASVPAAQTLVRATHTVQTAPQAPVVLEAPLYLDGREIARASARYTGRQMAFLEGL